MSPGLLALLPRQLILIFLAENGAARGQWVWFNKPVLCPGSVYVLYTRAWVLESWFKSVCVLGRGLFYLCFLFHFRCQDSSEDTPPATQNFIIPKKEIHTVPDMGKWKRSQAYADYIGFILTLNEGVKGKKLTFEYRVSEAIEKLVALLNTLDRWIDETPPMDQPSRFGNKAYRTWYAKLDQEAENLVATVVPTHLAAAVPEVAVYLKESVGNSTRIDYGTGHEAAFAAFLCCLCKIGVLRVDDQIAIVFKVFNRYLEVMRKLQKTYRMEPAGSQGVWGLDDFQFLPFIWGSSQLIDHPYLEPRHFVDEKAVNENHKDYMFLECILFITEMKTGPFAEHSNQLWNISAVPTWSKVNQGLIRMYKAECLEKFPVIQHFKFGSLLPIHPVSLC
ncbi:PREDICTED: serine/threonine-protein phosphatase 2A activator isoform X1 [Miniopterus natalensis]|nr:PREDICTED: serine/threonine-protein phosphatase 2A activator isoform X1 [Miniopterus natalensis]